MLYQLSYLGAGGAQGAGGGRFILRRRGLGKPAASRRWTSLAAHGSIAQKRFRREDRHVSLRCPARRPRARFAGFRGASLGRADAQARRRLRQDRGPAAGNAADRRRGQADRRFRAAPSSWSTAATRSPTKRSPRSTPRGRATACASAWSRCRKTARRATIAARSTRQPICAPMATGRCPTRNIPAAAREGRLFATVDRP